MIIETSNTNFRVFPPIGSSVKINNRGELIKGRRDRHRIGFITGYYLPKGVTSTIRPNTCVYRICLDNIPGSLVAL